MRRAERPLLQLPMPLIGGFLLVLLGQLLFHHFSPGQHEFRYQQLPNPLRASTYRGIAMGSEKLMGHLLAIRLQLHDNQAGRHFSYNRIDYSILAEWLEQITRINPSSEYPMLLASRVYSQTRDKSRLALMLEFIERNFDHDPQLHWRRLAEASVIAKHQLGDLELALRMAEKLALQPVNTVMPQWARDIRFLLLAELNEYESAIAIIEALLQSNAVTDPDEKRFLEEKLSKFQQELFKSGQFPKN
jgi:tetratricopeptide (TPR) repeat protein